MAEFTRSPTSAVLTDSRGYVVDESNPIPVNPAEGGAANMATAQTSVASTATSIVGVRSTRRGVLITNPSASVTVYIGGATVSTSTGQALGPGNSLSIPTTGAVYGIVASSTQTVTSVEIYD